MSPTIPTGAEITEIALKSCGVHCTCRGGTGKVVVFPEQSEYAIAAAEEAAFAKAAELEEGRAFAKVHTRTHTSQQGYLAHMSFCVQELEKCLRQAGVDVFKGSSAPVVKRDLL